VSLQFGLNQDQIELRSFVRGFMEKHSSLPAVANLIRGEGGYDERVWRLVCDELDLVGLAVPEMYGGSGATVLELCVALSEMGRNLYAGPFLSTALLAAPALLAIDDKETCRELLPLLVRGEVVVAVAGYDRWPGSAAPVQADEANGKWSLNGTAHRVIDGLIADQIIIFADTPSGPEGFLVDGAAAHRTAMVSLDLTRQLCECKFEKTPARALDLRGRGKETIEGFLDIVAVGIAAEAIGGAERILEIAVEHAKHRTQFGKPIGSFQAVKHRCASALLAVESAKQFALYAAWTLSVGGLDARVSASAAMACSTDAFVFASKAAIQVLGGIGYTWEHPAHLFLRRATSLRVLFGTPEQHRERHLSMHLAGA
jgi:alkylation response protein AidB-like acyl-CoA dehydrogenase